jgi:hypothetical protein
MERERAGSHLPHLELAFESLENSRRVRYGDHLFLWRVEVIDGRIRDSRLLTHLRRFAPFGGGFTTLGLQALDARNVLHHSIAPVAQLRLTIATESILGRV